MNLLQLVLWDENINKIQKYRKGTERKNKKNMNLKIFNRNNVIRIITILLLLSLWIYFSDINISYSNSFNLIRDKNIIINDEPPFNKHYNDKAIYENTIMKEIGNYAWLQFHEIINNIDISMDYKVTQNKKECDKLHKFLQLFSDLYPTCNSLHGSDIFNEILETNPIPTCSNKFILKLWGCHIHNNMNLKLGKNEFDCYNLFTEEELSSNDIKFNKVTLEIEEKQLG